jgi:hypothetical protein
VRDADGRECGLIIWESKRTKSWSEEWLAKLRDDQRSANAAHAVLVSQALPSGTRHFAERDGVWVTAWSHASAVAAVLRSAVLEVAHARLASEGRGDKMAMLYAYVTGPEFRNRVSGLIEALKEMEEDLDGEKRAMLSIWKKRERQLLRARENLFAFHGDLRGIAGGQFAEVFTLASVASPEPALLTAAGDDEEDEAPVQAEARAEDAPLVELLHSLVPADGTTVGNRALLDRFVQAGLMRLHVALSERDYARCKAALLLDGRLRKGKGKGGSVARATP